MNIFGEEDSCYCWIVTGEKSIWQPRLGGGFWLHWPFVASLSSAFRGWGDIDLVVGF
ncbi:hypothetical protein CRG98_009634 [Punica granatum]|uniref:Uncharacterized protein n=1 Tax=Punica granatum TaxID=22663 RepID=A0A2I0KNG3_PUNGR|nr:hypothetical protein CRG98_009634 [Punica granatum]